MKSKLLNFISTHKKWCEILSSPPYNVNIKRKDNIIKEIKLTGHAKYDEYGKDIVCAGVSTSLTVTINACLSFDKKSITYNESDPFILTNINESEITNKLLENLVRTLKDIESDYKKNITIKEE